MPFQRFCLEPGQLLLKVGNVAGLGFRFEAARRADSGLPGPARFVFLAESGSDISEHSLADDLFGVDDDRFAGEWQGLIGFACSKQLIGSLSATEGGGLSEGKISAIDENAVVDCFGGFEVCEVAIRIHR